MDKELAAAESPHSTQPRRGSIGESSSPDCVHFTEEQYRCITDLLQNPKFHCFIETPAKSKMSPSSSFPKWQELTAGAGKSFALVIPAGWLGLLKYGLMSTHFIGAEELYFKVLSSYEGALDAGMRAGTVTHQARNPYQIHFWMKLCFTHVGDGQFRAHLERGRGRKVKETFTIEKAKLECHQLASEALHINRTHKPTLTSAASCASRKFIEPVKHLPSNEQADEEETYDLLEGQHSLSFKEEVARMMAYVAVRMDKDGEEVDWEKLHHDVKNCHSGVIAAIGEAIDRHILEEQSSLLGTSGASTENALVALARKMKGRAREMLADEDRETSRGVTIRGVTSRGVRKTRNLEDEKKMLTRKKPQEKKAMSADQLSAILLTEELYSDDCELSACSSSSWSDSDSNEETTSSRLCNNRVSTETGKVKRTRVEALAEDSKSRRGTKLGDGEDQDKMPIHKKPRRDTHAEAADRLTAILLTEELSSDDHDIEASSSSSWSDSDSNEETTSLQLCSNGVSGESDSTRKAKETGVGALADEDRESRSKAKSSRIGKEMVLIRKVDRRSASGETGRGAERTSEHAPAQKHPRRTRETRIKASDQLAAILLTEELSSDSEVEYIVT